MASSHSTRRAPRSPGSQYPQFDFQVGARGSSSQTASALEPSRQPRDCHMIGSRTSVGPQRSLPKGSLPPVTNVHVNRCSRIWPRERSGWAWSACLRAVAILLCINLVTPVVAPVDQHHRDRDIRALITAVRTRISVHAAVRIPHTVAIAHSASVRCCLYAVQILLDIATDLAVARHGEVEVPRRVGGDDAW